MWLSQKSMSHLTSFLCHYSLEWPWHMNILKKNKAVHVLSGMTLNSKDLQG